MGDRVKDMLEPIMPAILGDDRGSLRAIAKADDEVDIPPGSVITDSRPVGQIALIEEQTHGVIDRMTAANDLGIIGDVV